MKNKTMKRALSLFLAAVMIALAIPFTMLPTMAAEEETIPTTIKNAKMHATYWDGDALHVKYGSVKGMIDGDKYDTNRSEPNNEVFPYFYSDPYAHRSTELYIDSIGTTRTYYGYALFELNGLSTLDDVTVWLAADGNSSSAAAAWSNTKAKWNIVNSYDILVSEDGVNWTLMSEVTGLHSTFPSSNATLAEKTSTGAGSYKILGNRVALNGAKAKYVAVAVSDPTNENAIVIGEVTVSGTTTVSSTSAKTPSEKYAEANEGDLLYTVNFKDPSWSDDYANAANHNSYYIISEDGKSVKHKITADDFGTGKKAIRIMWGGIAKSESFPLENENKYTVYYDVEFGSDDKTACGIQIDATNTLLVDRAGNSYWYQWITEKVGASVNNDENWTSKIGDKSVDAKQNFAVEVDPEAEKMTLYVADDGGNFHKVRTLTYDDAYIESAQKLICRIYVCRLGSGSPDNNNATVSNIRIYKGLVYNAPEVEYATIERVKMIATYGDGWALHPLYGSVAGMIDGDAYNTGRSINSDYPYFWSTPDACKNTSLYVNSIDETRTYYGYAFFELNAPSALDDVTIWLAADGHTEDAAVAWSDPNRNWNMNNAYDILVSEDGERWTLMGEYDDMCGTGSAAGAGWRAQESAGNIVSVIKGGYERLGHKIDLNGVTAKYVAVAVKECTNEKKDGNYLNQIVIGEVSVNGVTTEPVVGEKTPTEIYEETEDGDLLYSVNFKDTTYSDDYFNSNNYFSYYILSEDGTSVKHGLTKDKFNANNSKRARWGGIASDKRFTLTDEERYTIYFDAKFAGVTESFGIGIQVDSDDTIILDGAGNSYWYCWNAQKTGKSDNADENWLSVAGGDITKLHSFAIEINPHTDEMTLFVADASGVLTKVRTLTWYEGEGNSAYLNGLLECSIFALSIDGTEAGALTNCEISDIRIYKGLTAGETRTVYGASVRLDNPTGIRFRSQFSKSLIDSLMDTYGAENVKIGMLITPTDYITRNGVDFTMAALDACTAISGTKYVKIDATAIHENDSYYVINCALVKLLAGNYYRQFSARAYIEVNGEVYKYSEFNLKNNSRSVAEVAEKAYNDVKGTQDSVYSNAIKLDVGTTAYSPYTTDERNTLKGFFNENTSATLTVMTYNIRAYGDADNIWDSITGNYEGWAGRDPKLALGTITELMPDVVGLQEDDSNLEAQYKNVPALANNYVLYKAGGNGSEYNGIWVKKGITVLDQGTVYYKTEAAKYPDNENVAAADFSLDTKGDNSVGRFFRWVLVEKDGEQFLVVNTHLHYKASGTEATSDAVNKDLRKAQATLIRLWLVEMASTCSNQIVMGDMNAQEDSKEMKGGFLEGTGALSLAENNAVRLGDNDGTLVSEGFVERQPWAYDHIFFSANTLKTLEFSVVDNIDVGANTNYPSDHLPVVAKFIAK